MPIHEFDCRSCGTHFEALVRASRPAAGLHCPLCDGQDLQRLISAPVKPAGSPQADAAWAAGACGTCGHPDGPGACTRAA